MKEVSMDNRLKYALYASCGAAVLSFLISVWAVSKASLARRDVAALTQTSAAKREELRKELEGCAEKGTKLSSRLKAFEGDVTRLYQLIETVRAGRQETKEYANRKHKEALVVLEERLRALVQERDGKMKGLSEKMEAAKKELEKHVEDRCSRLKKYIDNRLSAY